MLAGWSSLAGASSRADTVCCIGLVFVCRHGPGTMMYANGDVYEGLWSRDQKHGPGTYFYMSRGKRFDGVWQVGPHLRSTSWEGSSLMVCSRWAED
jgi:hypothetical protein